MKHRYPEETISVGIIDNDAKGENGGTHYWVTQTIHMKITDSKEMFLKQAEKAFDLVRSNLVNS
jgi:hypothetical protein